MLHSQAPSRLLLHILLSLQVTCIKHCTRLFKGRKGLERFEEVRCGHMQSRLRQSLWVPVSSIWTRRWWPLESQSPICEQVIRNQQSSQSSIVMIWVTINPSPFITILMIYTASKPSARVRDLALHSAGIITVWTQWYWLLETTTRGSRK